MVKTKNSKQNLLFIVFLMALLSFSVYAAVTPNVHAAEPDAQENAMMVLNDVVGLNVTAYTPSLNTQIDNHYLSLPQEEADFNLASFQGKLRIRCSFVNNNLRQIYMSDYEGKLSLNQPFTNTVDMAKGFLQRYQNYTGNSFYGGLASMLDTVNVNENITKTNGSLKLEVSNFNQAIVDYIWTYIDANGVVAVSKNVLLSYRQGQLECFLNNWQLYTVTGTPKLSKDEAMAIALNASKNFSYKTNTDNDTLTVSDFKIAAIGNVTLSYLNSKEQASARGGDPFTLYPSWHVSLGFDKIYPGYVTGMTVAIWADTGEVSTMGSMIFDRGASSSNEGTITATAAFNLESTILSPLTVIAIMFSVVGVSLCSRKEVFSKVAGSRKLFSSRFLGTLLCVSVIFSLILTTVPNVDATVPTPDGKSMIYASMHDQLTYEQAAAVEVCNFIEDEFDAAGYDTTNFCGTSTTRTNVMNYAESAEEGHHRVAMFHFGHLHAFNTAYRDNNNVTISADDIYDKTELGKHVFTLIWVCAQARDRTSGMPEAWTHRDNSPGRPYMSDDGYINPDNGIQCYIGFYEASPEIGNETRTFEEQWTLPVKYFIKYFYEYALEDGYSVNAALNLASLDFFDSTYQNSIFHDGFNSWWPGPNPPADYYPSWMKVFGNGNIHLSPQYDFTVLAKDNYNNDLTQNPNRDVYIDIPYNIANTGATIEVTKGDHTFFVNDFWETVNGQCTGNRYTFNYYQFNPSTTYGYRVVEYEFTEDWTITAYFNKEYHPGDVNGDDKVNAADWNYFLDSYPSTRGEFPYTYDSTCDFDSDGDVDQTDYNYLDSLIHFITVPAYDQDGYSVEANVYIDGEYVGTTGNTFGVLNGSRTIEVSEPTGYSFDNYTYNGYTDYDNPTDITVTSDMTVTAYYTGTTNYWLTVLALEDMFWTYGEVDLYIDDEYVGKTGYAYEVSAGQHTIEVPDEFYDGGMTLTFDEWVETSDPDNPTTITVTSDTTITALYHVSF